MTLVELISSTDNDDMQKLSDDLWSALRRGLWAGYEDLMQEIGGVKEE